MLTPFGKEVRKLRIDRQVKLEEMSNRLSFSPSYLSAVENGKKNITPSLIDKIISYFSLSHEEAEELKMAALKSTDELTISTVTISDSRVRDSIAVFARRIQKQDVSGEEAEKLLEILNGRETAK